MLEDSVREARANTGYRWCPDHARVARLLPEQNCGVIQSADCNEIYFHRNAVTNSGFNNLALGDEMRFSSSMPRAQRVHRRAPRSCSATEAVRG